MPGTWGRWGVDEDAVERLQDKGLAMGRHLCDMIFYVIVGLGVWGETSFRNDTFSKENKH